MLAIKKVRKSLFKLIFDVLKSIINEKIIHKKNKTAYKKFSISQYHKYLLYHLQNYI